jgi:hypothetical protein
LQGIGRLTCDESAIYNLRNAIKIGTRAIQSGAQSLLTTLSA